MIDLQRENFIVTRENIRATIDNDINLYKTLHPLFNHNLESTHLFPFSKNNYKIGYQTMVGRLSLHFSEILLHLQWLTSLAFLFFISGIQIIYCLLLTEFLVFISFLKNHSLIVIFSFYKAYSLIKHIVHF